MIHWVSLERSPFVFTLLTGTLACRDLPAQLPQAGWRVMGEEGRWWSLETFSSTCWLPLFSWAKKRPLLIMNPPQPETQLVTLLFGSCVTGWYDTGAASCSSGLGLRNRVDVVTLLGARTPEHMYRDCISSCLVSTESLTGAVSERAVLVEVLPVYKLQKTEICLFCLISGFIRPLFPNHQILCWNSGSTGLLNAFKLFHKLFFKRS